jgi:hypothetical protein
MHRVYNSAFMNMLRDEKNAEYRLVIKNTLEFDPEILKRYVNFMNNPDERTAVDQFGKGDKYFGVATMLATMPGLPMFGHGQIEGFTERYGMEYRRSYWDEQPDDYLIERHEREIFPLLRLRRLFAEVKDFLLYDFFTPEGYVNEDVFAYSNLAGDERSLVVYHNKFASARGWVRNSAAYSVKTGADRALVQKHLAEGLALADGENTYTIFRDHAGGLEYIRQNRELFEKGLYLELDAYKAYVFFDFREVQDNEWRQYAQLAAYLDGRGVPSVEEALREIFLQPIHYTFRELANAGFFQWIIDNRLQVGRLEGLKVKGSEDQPSNLQPLNLQPLLDEAEQKSLALLAEIEQLTGGSGEPEAIAGEIRRKLEAALELPGLTGRPFSGLSKDQQKLAAAGIKYLLAGAGGDAIWAEGDIRNWGVLLGWLFTHPLGNVVGREHPLELSRSWIDEWLLGKILAGCLQDLGVDEVGAWQSVTIVRLLVGHGGLCLSPDLQTDGVYHTLQTWLKDGEVQRFLGVNRHQGILWFNREAFRSLVWWMFAVSVVEILTGEDSDQRPATGDQKGKSGQPPVAGSSPIGEKAASKIATCYQQVLRIQQAEEASGYQVEKLLEAAKP